MSETPQQGPLAEMTQTLEGETQTLKEVQEDLAEIEDWLDEAESEWERMSEQNQEAFRQRVPELRTKIRNVSTHDELTTLGGEIKKAFSEPIQQTAIAGLRDTIELLDIEFSSERQDEIETQIKGRPPSDLQADADGYSAVAAILKDEPQFIRELIAKPVQKDPPTYLINPTGQLTNLAQSFRTRRETLEQIEDAFANAGDWAEIEETSFAEQEALYEEIESPIEAEGIKTEIEELDAAMADIQYDVGEIVESEVRSALTESPPTELKSELNEVVSDLRKFESDFVADLRRAEQVVDYDTEALPETVASQVQTVVTKIQQFDPSQSMSIVMLRTVASSVTDAYEKLVVLTSTQLQSMDAMCSEVRMSFQLIDVEDAPTPDGLGDLSASAIEGHLPTAFDVLIAYNSWLDSAFEEISEQFETEDVQSLFERLHEGEEVPLTEVDLDALEALKGKLPLSVSLQG